MLLRSSHTRTREKRNECALASHWLQIRWSPTTYYYLLLLLLSCIYIYHLLSAGLYECACESNVSVCECMWAPARGVVGERVDIVILYCGERPSHSQLLGVHRARAGCCCCCFGVANSIHLFSSPLFSLFSSLSPSLTSQRMFFGWILCCLFVFFFVRPPNINNQTILDSFSSWLTAGKRSRQTFFWRRGEIRSVEIIQLFSLVHQFWFYISMVYDWIVIKVRSFYCIRTSLTKCNLNTICFWILFCGEFIIALQTICAALVIIEWSLWPKSVWSFATTDVKQCYIRVPRSEQTILLILRVHLLSKVDDHKD